MVKGASSLPSLSTVKPDNLTDRSKSQLLKRHFTPTRPVEIKKIAAHSVLCAVFAFNLITTCQANYSGRMFMQLHVVLPAEESKRIMDEFGKFDRESGNIKTVATKYGDGNAIG